MLHFGIKNTYKQRLFKYKGIGALFLWRITAASIGGGSYYIDIFTLGFIFVESALHWQHRRFKLQ